MKIAVTGKGGVGKTTIVALMARVLRDTGHDVLVIDADPDMNLSTLLGVPEDVKITPIVELKELIAERTGSEVGRRTSFFKLNPRVDDIPDEYCVEHEGLKLLVMGTVKEGGGGCACPENAFLKTLLSHLVIRAEEWILLDMEAGIEHLGRATATGMDEMIVVVEPNRTSIVTAGRIKKLARDIGLNHLVVVGNKAQTAEEKRFLLDNTNEFTAAGFIDYADEIRQLNAGNTSLFEIGGPVLDQVRQILDGLNPAGRALQDTA